MNGLLKKFLTSPLAIGLAALNAILAGGAALFGVVPALVALPLFALATGGEMVALLSSKPGAKAILAEQDRERAEHDTEKLAHAISLRKRLAVLRVDDPALKTSIDRIVLASGLYLDACAKGGNRDPRIEDAIEQAAEAVNGYLRIEDGARVGALLGSGGDSAGIAQRACALLDAATRTIEERLALPQGGIVGNHTALDELESRQELEE